MHIPDGYLSPLTCAALYGAAIPFWTIAFRRVRKLLMTRLVPLLSLFAAFSFVIMMFNLPLPGGTTGHAVGVGIATIVLGPSASIIAISVALMIQALFFGDGGITTLGANCFNMAIIGTLVTWGFYRLLSGNSPIRSRRRVIAAAIAGYAAINASALCAAIELGIQPMFFRDATGAPLYAPYPLHIAIPAMMIGHLTLAGLAELIITGGVVAYLQHHDPSLLVAEDSSLRRSSRGWRSTASSSAASRAAPDIGMSGHKERSAFVAEDSNLRHSSRGSNPSTSSSAVSRAAPDIGVSGHKHTTRPLWIGLASLMVATPLGLLATGAAWGEWNAGAFASRSARSMIVSSSGNAALPSRPPAGLERLASIWTAPFRGYAPSILQNRSFGYILSAMFGVGLICLSILLIQLAAEWLTQVAEDSNLRHSSRRSKPPASDIGMSGHKDDRPDTPVTHPRSHRNFLERTTDSLLEVAEHSLYAEKIARGRGLMQALDPRVKLIGIAGLIVAAALSRSLVVIAAIFALAILLSIASHIPLSILARRAWIGAFLFTAALALPALILTPGHVVSRLPLGMSVTREGLRTTAYLIGRVETAVTLSLLLILTTLWSHILHALRVLRLPVLFIVILGMTYRYIFVLLQAAHDMFTSRRSRHVGRLTPAESRRVASATAGVLLSRTVQLSGDVYLAMQSRGFRGDVYLLDELTMSWRDRAALATLLLATTAAIWLGR